MTTTIGLIGGRGFTGRELLRLINGHPEFELAFAVSTSQAGTPVADVAHGWRGDQAFENLTPEEAAGRGADAFVLATPNGETGAWVDAIEAAGKNPVILDISADHRFDDAWAYGLPELHRDALRGARRIANPGCYATALQLAAAPLKKRWAHPPHGFAVSGWSGAGSKRNDRNDPDHLAGNIVPYAAVDHVHEREASRHLGFEARLSPHVGPFFRGIVLSLAGDLTEPLDEAAAEELYAAHYGDEPMVKFERREAEVRDAVETPWAVLGAPRLGAEGRRIVVTAAVDNLLKGAASQAMQNLNLAFGFDEFIGLERAR